MPEFIETVCYTVAYGSDVKEEKTGGFFFANRHYVSYYTNWKEYKQRLKELILQLNADQCEIKAMVPLTTGQAACHYETAEKRSFGLGYGLSNIIGFCLLAQRKVAMSEDEYNVAVVKAVKMMGAASELPALEKQAADLKTACEKDAESLGIKFDINTFFDNSLIKEEKSLFGKKWLIYRKNFSSHEEAESFLAGVNERANKLRNIETRLDEMRHSLEEGGDNYKVFYAK